MDWAPGAVTGTLALIGVILTAWFQSKRERKASERAEQAALRAERTPTPPTTQQVWERLDHVENVLRAAVGVIGEVAEQLPDDFQLVLSARYVATLSREGYLPPEWEPVVDGE